MSVTQSLLGIPGDQRAKDLLTGPQSFAGFNVVAMELGELHDIRLESIISKKFVLIQTSD
jgi:hypothetical protein